MAKKAKTEPAAAVETAAAAPESVQPAPAPAPKAPRAKAAPKAPKAKAAPKAPKAKEAPKAKAAPAEEIIIQYGGAEWDLAALKEKVTAAYVADGHRMGRASSVKLYVKPEERKVYYVIGKYTGSVDFEA